MPNAEDLTNDSVVQSATMINHDNRDKEIKMESIASRILARNCVILIQFKLKIVKRKLTVTFQLLGQGRVADLLRKSQGELLIR